MVRVASAGKGLRWIVAGLLLAILLVAGSWSPGVYAGPGLSPACEAYIQPYVDWVNANPLNYVGFSLVSNQGNQGMVYAARHIPMAYSPPGVGPGKQVLVAQFFGTAGPGADLSDWVTWQNGAFGEPFSPFVNDTLTLTISLDGTLQIAATNLNGGSPFFLTFDCNWNASTKQGVIIGQSTDYWATAVLISLEKLARQPPPG